MSYLCFKLTKHLALILGPNPESLIDLQLIPAYLSSLTSEHLLLLPLAVNSFQSFNHSKFSKVKAFKFTAPYSLVSFPLFYYPPAPNHPSSERAFQMHQERLNPFPYHPLFLSIVKIITVFAFSWSLPLYVSSVRTGSYLHSHSSDHNMCSINGC